MRLMISGKDSVKVVTLDSAELLTGIDSTTVFTYRRAFEHSAYLVGRIECESHALALELMKELHETGTLKVNDLSFKEETRGYITR